MGEKVAHGKVEGIGGEELRERIREAAGLQRNLLHCCCCRSACMFRRSSRLQVLLPILPPMSRWPWLR